MSVVHTTESGKRRAKQKVYRIDLLPYLLLLPSVAVILGIIFYPFLSGFYYSLTDGSLLQAGEFVGLGNYLALLHMPDFWHSLYFSGLFALFNVLGCYVIGLGLAMLVNQNVPMQGFFRVALLVPWIIPSVVSVVSWRWLIADHNGLVNILLGKVGVGPIYFLSTEGWAMFSVILIKVWRSFPFMMLSLLAALQSIDRTMYEAAELDGAGPWQTFWFVTLPQLTNISIVLWILMTIWTINDFDTPWLLTKGGPSNATENLIVLAYKYTFARNDVGLGAAISFVTLILLMILAVILLRRQREA
jgi:ABC-type sugar transport system permease subunit